MIQLYDRFNQSSRDLHESLAVAQFSGLAVVIEPDGFLPDGVISPFTYYTQSTNEIGKPLFFDQLAVPSFWEITGSNQDARVLDEMEERARIHYAESDQPRLIKQVDWLDKAGAVRQADHYNKHGFCFAKTTYDEAGQAIFTKYLTRQGFERILENHVTGDILLTLEGEPVQHFPNRVRFVQYFLETIADLSEPIIFNTLASSFMVSFGLGGSTKQDALVWQEPLGDSLPGNMRLVLEDNNLRANHVLIPDHVTYARALELVPKEQQHKLIPLGYTYQFKRENFVRKDALILTNSDQIEHLETLVEALPDVTFRVAAVTEMSQKLLSMLRFPNVVLYQNASQSQLAELYRLSDIYLDINYSTELQHAVRKAFEHNLLVLAFAETAHDVTYTAPEHIYPKLAVDRMIGQITRALADVEGMQEALIAQGRHANYVDKASFTQQMTKFLGERNG